MSIDTSQGTTRTVVEFTHDRMIEAADVVNYLRNTIRLDRSGIGNPADIARCIDAVSDVTPYKHVSRFTVEVEHDPEELTAGDVEKIISSYLVGADRITCFVCRETDGGCCEFGPDKAAA